MLGLVALMALILGVLVLKKSKRRHDAKHWFFLVCLCLAVWSAGLEVFSLADKEVTLDTASRWFYVASAVFVLRWLFSLQSRFFHRQNQRRVLSARLVY